MVLPPPLLCCHPLPRLLPRTYSFSAPVVVLLRLLRAVCVCDSRSWSAPLVVVPPGDGFVGPSRQQRVRGAREAEREERRVVLPPSLLCCHPLPRLPPRTHPFTAPVVVLL